MHAKTALPAETFSYASLHRLNAAGLRALGSLATRQGRVAEALTYYEQVQFAAALRMFSTICSR